MTVEDPGGSAAATEDLQAKIATVRARRAALEGHRRTLEQSGEEELSLTDPDSRVMKTAKIAVDPKHRLIADRTNF